MLSHRRLRTQQNSTGDLGLGLALALDAVHIVVHERSGSAGGEGAVPPRAPPQRSNRNFLDFPITAVRHHRQVVRADITGEP